MNIGIIDADLLDNGTRHPNLALMKISAYLKCVGNTVRLLHSYDEVSNFDMVFLSKVFTRTIVPISVESSRIVFGGTGFFLDKAPDLPRVIEHHKPDYHLYDEYIEKAVIKGKRLDYFSDYLYYSIGFTTRGCFRKCSFCVNSKYERVIKHSPIMEFFDPSRKYIYLWDDNFLGFNEWEDVLEELSEVNRPFQFRQGLDIRLLTEKKAEKLCQARYHGDFIFAFDFIKEEHLVKKGLEIWRNQTRRSTKLYLLCAYESIGVDDIYNLFYRIRVLMSFGCLPYVMRYENWKNSAYSGMYLSIARWCNQPAIFKKMSFKQFCIANGYSSSTMKYFRWFIDKHPSFPTEFLEMRFEELSQINRA